ncbi:hypothetical protein [Pollutibacter soli]|uniref:hypothetical protein n=1 Tax=Pollutibacter soli TaxID=3034157 RepID=UPI0030140350
MRSFYKHLLLLVPVLLLGIKGISQNKVEQGLQKLDSSFSQEKIYIEYNKDFYVSGETIWFKAIVFEGYQKSFISTSLHVELLDAQKQTVAKLFLPVLDGETNGNIELKDSLPESTYYIRAYTEWMLNFNEAFQYIQPLRIYNPSSTTQLIPNKTSVWKAAAFPEAGNFIQGVNTKVAVRLFSDGKLPDTWTGYVIEKSKPAEKITTFESLDPNVGFFFLAPELNQQYQVVVEDGAGKSSYVDLPAAAPSGVSIQLNTGKGIIHYALRSVNPTVASVPCFIVGTVNNTVVYKANGAITASGIVATIPTKDMENGVFQLTVFDASNKVLIKRLCFIDAANLKMKFPAVASPDFTDKARASNSISIFPDTSFDHYSVLISEAGADPITIDQTYYGQLWLNSDFPKNKIYKPESFFASGKSPAALDAFLMTEEWQRFEWEDVVNEKFPSINFKPLPYLSYQGTATLSNQPAGNMELNLIFKYADSSSQMQLVQTDDKGQFNLYGMLFENSVQVYYQLNDKKINKKNLKVSFVQLNKTAPYNLPLPGSGYQALARDRSIPTDPEVARAILAHDNYKVVDEKIKSLETVLVKGKKKTPTELLNEQLSTPMYRRNNEIVFDMVNDNKTAVNYQNILQYLQGRVPGLQVMRDGADWVPIIRGGRASVYVDENLVDVDMVSAIPVSNIAMVKVTRGVFSGASGADASTTASVVLIYTHRNGTKSSWMPTADGMTNSTLPGFNKINEFPLANYSNPAQQPEGKDTRSVLYWNPFWRSESATPEPISFYNNDELKKIQVTIIGFLKSESAPVYFSQVIPDSKQ